MKTIWTKFMEAHKSAYRGFSLGKLNTPQFSHLWLVLYWPIYGLLFSFVERGWTDRDWILMHGALDDVIPFCEWFVIPYMYWFVFLIGILVLTLMADPEAFWKMMVFIIITYSVAIMIYLLVPTAQELRPDHFERDNLLTRFMAGFYNFDTNTNVCPSIHVLGSVAVMFTSFHCRMFRGWGWKCYHIVTTVLITLSTVFLKQHSVLDIYPALILCAVAYPFAYHWTGIKALFRRVFRLKRAHAEITAPVTEEAPEGEPVGKL